MISRIKLLALPSPKGFFQPSPSDSICLVALSIALASAPASIFAPTSTVSGLFRVLPQGSRRARRDCAPPPGPSAKVRQRPSPGLKLQELQEPKGSTALMPFSSNPDCCTIFLVPGVHGEHPRKGDPPPPGYLLGRDSIFHCDDLGPAAWDSGKWELGRAYYNQGFHEIQPRATGSARRTNERSTTIIHERSFRKRI